MAENSVSAHYLIGKDGALFQFVPDSYRAWHAGVDSNTRALYKKGAQVWQRYLKYFNWFKGYSKGAIYLDGDLKPVWDETEAAFVAHGDNSLWTEFDYFRNRWNNADYPVNFSNDPDPNNYSIGIETLGFGSKNGDAGTYTPEMYSTLQQLLADLSAKYGIPLKKGRVIGHEDVNPIGRFGWDPSTGFNWSNIYRE